MRHAAFLLAIASILTLGPVPVAGQPPGTSASAPTEPPPQTCWRGKPGSACHFFWITEFGYELVNSSTSRRYVSSPGTQYEHQYTLPDFQSRFVWTIGPMVNRGLQARGGTLSVAPTTRGFRAALEARQRWWSPAGSSIDVSAGVMRMDFDVAGSARQSTEYGATAGVFLVGGDLIEITGRADLVVGQGRPRVGTAVGAGLGSYAAAGAMVLFVGLIALVAASINGEW